MSKTFERTSITLPVALKKRALVKAKKEGFETSFSAWIAKLINDELKRK